MNHETVLRDTFRLACTLLADEQIARLATSESDPLILLREQFVEDELVHLLIGTAVMNRTHDDHMSGPRGDESEPSFPPVDMVCGVLLRDVDASDPKKVELDFREACNKIIHAEQITAETERLEDSVLNYLPHMMVLRGTGIGRNGKAWQAHLNVLDYVRGTLINFRGR